MPNCYKLHNASPSMATSFRKSLGNYFICEHLYKLLSYYQILWNLLQAKLKQSSIKFDIEQ